MVNGLWGKKVGMTQIFSDTHKVIPVTLIDMANWYITQVKTMENDGYQAIQMGCVKSKFTKQEFLEEWTKDTKKYFSVLREVRLKEEAAVFTVGEHPDLGVILEQNQAVDVFGISIGRGFSGAMKRHGFKGGRASHGDKLGRAPGSLGNMRSRGRVIKGKKLPGQFGVEKHVMKNLKIIKIDPQSHMVFVKGSVPGKTGSLVFLKKRG